VVLGWIKLEDEMKKKSLCGGIHNTGKCSLTGKEWLEYGLSPQPNTPTKCSDIGSCDCVLRKTNLRKPIQPLPTRRKR